MTTSYNYRVFENSAELARIVGQLLVDATKGEAPVYIALSGGSTPQDIFDVLAGEFRMKINWQKFRFYWVDERCVPPSHPDSNFGMAWEHLFSKLDIAPHQIHRVMGESAPEEALAQYTRLIQTTVPLTDGIPQFNLTFLGMGDDGHTASIFPHQIELWHSFQMCELATHPVSQQKRITLTGRVINHSQQIVFMVTGANKAAKVHEIFTQSPSSIKYPASLVEMKNTLWLLDQAAISKIS
jgi:6-phosphogluconolactonase